MKDAYRVRRIKEEIEKLKTDEYYLVQLKGFTGKGINLDEGALRLLLEYYEEDGL